MPRRDYVSSLRVADRRRNARRIPPQAPDFAGVATLSQTTLSGSSYIPPLPVPDPPDLWNTPSVPSPLGGSSAAESSWIPAIAPQYADPYPAALLVENAAVDGGPYLGNCFLPFVTASPALRQPSFFVETSMLSTQTMTDRETTLAARYQAVAALQERINNPVLSTTDETIAQAVKLASNDLCYGETQDLPVHIHGIQELTRLRGGFEALGMHGTLAKMVIIVDRITAIALECPPTYTVSEVSPYLSPTISPSVPTPSSLDPATSALLKDVIFLLDTVLALPAVPSEWELQKVATSSSWLHGRLAPTSPSSSSSSSLLHQPIRLASLMYCRAIQARKPFSQVISEQDVCELIDAVWRVPLETWNETQGLLPVLIWVLAGILPIVKDMQAAYTTKTMMMAAAVQMAMLPGIGLSGEGSGVVDILERVTNLQRWLEGATGTPAGTARARGSRSPGMSSQL